jgi:2-iminobutanoate/2-iminopropanoate deaminase
MTNLRNYLLNGKIYFFKDIVLSYPLVEIKNLLYICQRIEKGNRMKKIIVSENAPRAIGPYSQAVEANGFIFISGQLGLNPKTGMLVEGIEKQTEQTLKNLGAILEAAGCSYEDVIKCTVLLDDLDNFKLMNEIYSAYFSKLAPARAAYGVVRLPMGAMIEIEAIAVKK